MTPSNLTAVKVGDFLKRPARGQWRLNVNQPRVQHRLIRVDRETKTLLICGGTQVRKSNGKIVGRDYEYASIATPEDIQIISQEEAVALKYAKAFHAAQKIWDKPLHQHGLTTAQLEVLAEAWKQVQALGEAARVAP